MKIINFCWSDDCNRDSTCCVTAGKVRIGHVPDAENPADFLTKWVSKAKLTKSYHYIANMKTLKLYHKDKVI